MKKPEVENLVALSLSENILLCSPSLSRELVTFIAVDRKEKTRKRKKSVVIFFFWGGGLEINKTTEKRKKAFQAF
jgi:hypothetical protein